MEICPACSVQFDLYFTCQLPEDLYGENICSDNVASFLYQKRKHVCNRILFFFCKSKRLSTQLNLAI